MSWETVNKSLTSDYFTLRNDGDQSLARFASEPVAITDDYNGSERTRYAFALVTADGLRIWTVGPRILGTIQSNWKLFLGKLLNIVRVGAAGDMATRYDITVVAEQDKTLIPNKWTHEVVKSFVESRVTLAPCEQTAIEDEIPF